jgi:hypothetical protein
MTSNCAICCDDVDPRDCLSKIWVPCCSQLLREVPDNLRELKTLNETINRPEPEAHKCDVFPTHIARQLKQLNAASSILAQQDIQGVVTRYRMRVTQQRVVTSVASHHISFWAVICILSFFIVSLPVFRFYLFGFVVLCHVSVMITYLAWRRFLPLSMNYLFFFVGVKCFIFSLL